MDKSSQKTDLEIEFSHLFYLDDLDNLHKNNNEHHFFGLKAARKQQWSEMSRNVQEKVFHLQFTALLNLVSQPIIVFVST